MSDYTPTTGEMVLAYTFANPTGPRDEREAEALRWLAQVKAEAFAEGAWAQVQALEFQRGATVPIPANPYRSEQ